jgi:hypothetical protein
MYRMNDKEKRVIYDKLRTLLVQYTPPFTLRQGRVKDKSSVELWAEGNFEVGGKRRTEMYFAGLIAQSKYVGFYFMPIYSDEHVMRRVFSERLLKCLKGKSCFYITQLDDELLADIKHALAEGFKLYEQRGWV